MVARLAFVGAGVAVRPVMWYPGGESLQPSLRQGLERLIVPRPNVGDCREPGFLGVSGSGTQHVRPRRRGP